MVCNVSYRSSGISSAGGGGGGGADFSPAITMAVASSEPTRPRVDIRPSSSPAHAFALFVGLVAEYSPEFVDYPVPATSPSSLLSSNSAPVVSVPIGSLDPFAHLPVAKRLL